MAVSPFPGTFGWLGDRDLMLGVRSIPKKSDKVGFRSMRYISLLPVIQKFYIRALQSAVRRERTT